MSWGPTGATRQRSVLVNSVRQNTLRTRKAFPEKTTTCIWLTLSYEAWYCARLLKKICTLVHNVTISWTIKDEISFMTHNLRLSFEYSHFADTPSVKQKATSKSWATDCELASASKPDPQIDCCDTGKGLHMFLSRVLQADSCKEPKLRSLLSLASVQQLSTCRLWCSTSSDQETTQQRLGDQTAASEVERRLILDDHSRQTLYCESKTVSSQPFCCNPFR